MRFLALILISQFALGCHKVSASCAGLFISSRSLYEDLSKPAQLDPSISEGADIYPGAIAAMGGAGRAVLRNWSPEEHHFVFVGRSLEFMEVMFKLQGVPSVQLLPFSSARIQFRRIDEERQSRAGLEQKLKEYMKTALPNAEQLDGKKIVFLDFTQDYSNLVAFAALVKIGLEPGVSYEIVGLAREKENLESSIKVEGLPLITVMPIPYTLSSVLDGVRFGDLKKYSRYERYVPLEAKGPPSPVASSNKHGELVKTLHDYLQEADPLDGL